MAIVFLLRYIYTIIFCSSLEKLLFRKLFKKKFAMRTTFKQTRRLNVYCTNKLTANILFVAIIIIVWMDTSVVRKILVVFINNNEENAKENNKRLNFIKVSLLCNDTIFFELCSFSLLFRLFWLVPLFTMRSIIFYFLQLGTRTHPFKRK